MNNERFGMTYSLIKNVTSSHNSVAYSSLCQIRDKIIINEEGIKLFCHSGGFSALVALLGRPNPKILNVALSILGNCSRHAEYSKKVGELRIFEPLVKIIQTISTDSILSRACRLLGNLSTDERNAIAFHNSGAVWTVVSLLDMHVNSGDESPLSLGTVSMAIRALGMLWIAEPCREDIISVNGVKLTVSILINHYSNKNNDIKCEFIHSVLKVLLIFTAKMNICKPSARYVNQINDNGNDGYKCLVGIFAKQILSDDTKVANHKMINTNSEMAIDNSDMALKIICRLSLNAECRTLLITAGVLDFLTDRVETKEALECLIKLCGDRINCTRVARTTALDTVLKVAKDTSSITKLSEILNIFVLYIDHKTTLMKLVKHGLIAVLLKVINIHVDLNGCQHVPLTSKNKYKRKRSKRSPKESTPEELSRKIKRLNGISKDDIDLLQATNVLNGLANSSPPASLSYSEASSSRSPSWNSEQQSEADNDDCDEDYSPVCSDAEDDPLPVQFNAMGTPLSDSEDGITTAITNTYSFLGEIASHIHDFADEDTLYTKLQNNSSKEVYTVTHIALLLLEQIVSSKHLLPELARSDTTMCLIKYLAATNQPLRTVTQILGGIISRLEYLKMILHTEFAYELLDLRDTDRHDCCPHCYRVKRSAVTLSNKLIAAAESDCGVGEIENVLLTGSIKSKEKFAMLVPFLINDGMILKKIMNKCSGVNILMSLISEKSYNQKPKVITALFKYANKIKAKPLYDYYNKSIPYIPLNKDKMKSFPDDDRIVFRLDGGVDVSFSKELLCEASDVFSVMLTNCEFIESNSNEIRLKGFSESGLRYFLYLLENNHSISNEIFPVSNRIRIAAEAFLLADKYLILDLKEKLVNAISQFLVEIDNIYECYELAIKCPIDFLRLQCISLIFLDIKEEEQHKTFEDFEKSDLKGIFYRDIVSYLTS